MITILTSNEREFVNRMTKGSEYAITGFQLLLERRPDTLHKYFYRIKEKRLFAFNNNQRPIPSWAALEYLAAVAKITCKQNKEDLAVEIMTIVRTGSRNTDSKINSSENHYACYMFAKIIGLVPLTVVKMDDIDLIRIWLDNEFNSGLTIKELSDGILQRLINENDDKSLKKASRVLYHCTALKREKGSDLGLGRRKLATIADDYQLERLLKKYIPSFAEKIPEETVKILIKRLKFIFVDEKNRSDLIRPAIEEHDQNHQWERSINCLVDGLRDIIAYWFELDSQTAQAYIDKLKDEKTGIIQRIVIHTLNRHWAVLNNIYIPMSPSDLFQDEYIHEMYGLLSERFREMTQTQKDVTLDAIRNLPKPDYDEENGGELLLKQEQRNWLSAITGKGNKSVDQWYSELNANENIGELSPHPSFSVYTEYWRGPGPSSYTVQDLLDEAKNGTLIDLLNNFEETDSWRGPTISALSDALIEAVKQEPNLFYGIITQFANSNRPYQFAIIKGFRQLWDEKKRGIEKDQRLG